MAQTHPTPAHIHSVTNHQTYALGSLHAVTRDGTLVIASAWGGQLASCA